MSAVLAKVVSPFFQETSLQKSIYTRYINNTRRVVDFAIRLARIVLSSTQLQNLSAGCHHLAQANNTSEFNDVFIFWLFHSYIDSCENKETIFETAVTGEKRSS